MTGAMRQVVAFGGGGFSQESGNPLLDDYVLGLTGTVNSRVCFLPTASGDADHYVVRFYNSFRDRARPSHISLFRRERGVPDIRSHLLAQDLIYVGGGSLISLLGVWRAHGIDSILREAYEAGVILCGLSAGSLAGSPRRSAATTTRSTAFPRSASCRIRTRSTTATGQGAEPSIATCSTGCRRASPPRMGPRCASWATAVEVVASRPEARAYKLERRGGQILETRLATRYLGAEAPATLTPGLAARPRSPCSPGSLGRLGERQAPHPRPRRP